MSGKGNNPTIKERLTCVETKQDSILEKLDNHLKHHWEFSMVLLSAILIEALALAGIAIRYFLK